MHSCQLLSTSHFYIFIMRIKLGYSTCPNDTFMFYALAHGQIDTGDIEYEFFLDDILHLNKMAMSGSLDMVKISYNTYGKVLNTYRLLDAGSALGHNCGPLLIAKHPYTKDALLEENVAIAIPGFNTTANLLLSFYAPNLLNRHEMLFHEIMPAIIDGRMDAGVIIHENRFTYQKHGLISIQDLGEYWEGETKLPIPLGAIVAKKELGTETFALIQKHLRESIAYAFGNPEPTFEYVRAHAQEMEEEVMRSHIDLYVNAYSLSLGSKGREAVKKVLEVGEYMGLYDTGTVQVFNAS